MTNCCKSDTATGSHPSYTHTRTYTHTLRAGIDFDPPESSLGRLAATVLNDACALTHSWTLQRPSTTSHIMNNPSAAAVRPEPTAIRLRSDAACSTISPRSEICFSCFAPSWREGVSNHLRQHVTAAGGIAFLACFVEANELLLNLLW